MQRLLGALVVLCVTGVAVAAQGTARGTAVKAPGCRSSEGALRVPAGFCSTVFADGIGHARHLVVAPNGVVYVNTWSGRYYENDTPHAGGFLVALEDTNGTGTANINQRFGGTAASGDHGGTGIALYHGALFAESNDRIVKYSLTGGAVVPREGPVTVVSGLPLGGDHPMHPFLIDADGMLYVDVGSATNSCQRRNRSAGSPGVDPCTELATRGGTWRFDANRVNQTFTPAQRFATGIRNGEGFAIDPGGRHLFVTMHGRDQLHANWPALYRPEEEATQPAEELLLLAQGADYGWPECYYDAIQGKLVLAPEYGGDGGKRVGICARKQAPIAAFPAHWAPNDATFYAPGGSFPERYHGGIFIAFHGSWDRAPYPQQGYNVVFQALEGDHARGPCEVFADGFAGGAALPGTAQLRPSGVAVGPDGALYVSDDVRGRIYRIVYTGAGAGGAAGDAGGRPCPSPAADPGGNAFGAAQPPEGIHEQAEEAAVAAGLPVPPGATHEMVVLGDRIFHGEGGATCTGCHGVDAKGTPLGPNLTDHRWLWGDGSYASIEQIIRRGVPEPKQHRSPMPPMGGAPLRPEQLSAVAAYVWALRHHSSGERP